mmetsp:Transcript_27733/g.50001  ORF Transcript_27733/g.50001 Transcript_27733/m.50001 type:complete len:149 (+) Transcript_27733:909-1355(+)
MPNKTNKKGQQDRFVKGNDRGKATAHNDQQLKTPKCRSNKIPPNESTQKFQSDPSSNTSPLMSTPERSTSNSPSTDWSSSSSNTSQSNLPSPSGLSSSPSSLPKFTRMGQHGERIVFSPVTAPPASKNHAGRNHSNNNNSDSSISFKN